MTALPVVRQGACQPVACGSACCRFMVLEVNPIYRTDRDQAAWLGLHGVDLLEVNGRTVARVPVPCSALTEAGACGLYGTPERPEMCETFPDGPLALIGLEDVCTYTFRRA